MVPDFCVAVLPTVVEPFAGPPTDAPAAGPVVAPPTTGFGPFEGPPTCARAGEVKTANVRTNPVAASFMSIAPSQDAMRRPDFILLALSFPQRRRARKRNPRALAERRRADIFWLCAGVSAHDRTRL